MLYRELPATAATQNVVACFWEFAAGPSLPPEHLHSIPLDGCVSLAYARSRHAPPRTAFVGPRIHAAQVPISPGDRIWGVQFLPGASSTAIGKSGSDLRDQIGLLDFVIPELASEVRAKLQFVRSLEEAAPIFGSLINTAKPCPIVGAAVLAITKSRGTIKIGDVPA